MGLRSLLIGQPDVFFPEVKFVLFDKEIGMVEPTRDGVLFTAKQIIKLEKHSQFGLKPFNILPQPDGRVLVSLKDEIVNQVSGNNHLIEKG